MGCLFVLVVDLIALTVSFGLGLENPTTWIIAVLGILFFAAGGFAAAVCLLQRRLGAMVVTSLFMGLWTFAAVVRAFASLDHGLHEALVKALGFVAGVAVCIPFQKYISPLARTNSTRQPNK